MKITIVWESLTGPATTHEFDSKEQAEPWLKSVLEDEVPQDLLDEGGYTNDGLGMLACYKDEGLDSTGRLTVFVDGTETDSL